MSISVVGVVSSWEVVQNVDSWTGTREYVDAAVLPAITPEDLPEIGDSWDLTWIGLRVNSIRMFYLGDDPTCGKKYTVNYSTLPIESDTSTDYPTTIELSADYQTYSDSKEEYTGTNHWVWPDGKRASELKFRKREITSTIVVHRFVYDSNLNDFMAASTACSGLVNVAATDINDINVGIGQALYLGSSASETRTESGSKKWLVQLKFAVKAVSLTAGTAPSLTSGYGWNYVYRPAKNTYEKVTFGGDPLYNSTSFAALYTTSSTP